MEKEVKRGYVKWEDENGVLHKELLSDHPELLKAASPREQLAAEEAKRMNAAGEKTATETEEEGNKFYLDTLADLKAAPADVLTAADLALNEVPTPNVETSPINQQPAKVEFGSADDEREATLKELREATS